MADFQPAREEQLTEKQLKWAEWWVTHKVQVRRIFVICMIVLDTALVGYALFGFADWFFGSGELERRQIAQLTRQWTDFDAFRQKTAPQPLAIDDPLVLLAGERRYDFVSQATNPSPLWWVEFDYRFTAGSLETAPKRGFLLPGETKWLEALGTRSDFRPSSPKIVVENVIWHRVNLHKTRPDYVTWATSRLNFLLTDVRFKPPDPKDPVPISRATFTVTNDTGFGFYRLGFFVTLRAGTRIVGVNKVVISDLRAGEKREVDASWFTDLPNVNKVEVKPEVNIFDERIYIPPGQ